MKILKFPDKKWSWLQWPVTLRGLSAEHHLHVTAKFFGGIEINPFEIIDRCPMGLSTWQPKDFTWVPSMFAKGHVLHITIFPQEMLHIHEVFKEVPDQFDPWKPHISVPRNYWIEVDECALTPESEELKFGELELCLGSQQPPQQVAEEIKCK